MVKFFHLGAQVENTVLSHGLSLLGHVHARRLPILIGPLVKRRDCRIGRVAEVARVLVSGAPGCHFAVTFLNSSLFAFRNLDIFPHSV